MPRRRPNPLRPTATLLRGGLFLGVLLPALLAACAAGETSVKDGRTHLRSVAIANYTLEGGERLDRLLDLLSGAPPAGGDPAAERLEAARRADVARAEAAPGAEGGAATGGPDDAPPAGGPDGASGDTPAAGADADTGATPAEGTDDEPDATPAEGTDDETSDPSAEGSDDEPATAADDTSGDADPTPAAADPASDDPASGSSPPDDPAAGGTAPASGSDTPTDRGAAGPAPRIAASSASLAEGRTPGASDASSADGPATGLSLDLALMTEVTTRGGRRILQALPDGAPLLDGFGRVGDGDGLKLSLQTDRPCTLYVLLVDATGRPSTLFPNAAWSTVGNPVRPGRPYRLPQGNVLFPLSEHRGTETLYIIASPEPWLELESLLAELDAAPWEPRTPTAAVERAARITRGLADTAPSLARAVSAPAGTLSDVTSVRYTAEPGERLVVTRWFRHR